MVQFAEVFPAAEIVVSLIRNSSWTYFIARIPLNDPVMRVICVEMCRVEGWSVRPLCRKIDGTFSERTALSPKPDGLILQVINDNYFCRSDPAHLTPRSC